MFTDTDSPLFGFDKRLSLVAVESANEFVRLFIRDGDDVRFVDQKFKPFILASTPQIFAGSTIAASMEHLDGDLYYKYLFSFDSWGEACEAHDFLQKRFTENPKPFLYISDLSQQFMIRSGVTLFKGMELSDLKTLSIDIETDFNPESRFSNLHKQDDKIISIACIDSKGCEKIFSAADLSEAEIIENLSKHIAESDPDVITGHNIFRFDLDYIWKRAKHLNIKLKWGRNGSEPIRVEHSRFQLPERVIEFPKFIIYGRHIIDTYFLAELYDLAPRVLESRSLKYVAKHFGIAAENRTYIDYDKISATMKSSPKVVEAYNLDDAKETLSLFNLLAKPWFVQSQFLPYRFQSIPLSGNATRINSLMLRAYLKNHHSIPAPPLSATDSFEGGYTELPVQGIFSPVVHCDVASLYPSIMLCYQIAPRNDKLNIFLSMLSLLKKYRLEVKIRARNAISQDEKNRLETLQQVFKTLINSFFGYLGAKVHNFADPEQAAEVTRLGRVTIKEIMNLIKEGGGKAREVDTDGIYFTPSPDIVTEDDEKKFVAKISDMLPIGIDLEHDGRYRSILAYKAKNYALLTYSDRVIIRGSALKSRALEPYLKKFLKELIELILQQRVSEIEFLYDSYLAQLSKDKVDIDDITKSETLNESIESYIAKVKKSERNRSAAFETAIASKKNYRAGDVIKYYVTGVSKDVTLYQSCRLAENFKSDKSDINIAYYKEKLRLLKSRFDNFLPKEPTLFDF